MSTPTEFDKEFRQIIRTAIRTARGDAVHSPDEALAEEVALEKSKQVVDKYVIETKTPNISLDSGERYETYHRGQTELRVKQHQSLWGDKK